ncbi:MAG TPA: serine hydrolase domain-containing protein [Iamia sp.]|nr:serine hydrolase domain-containing protein [Iamia sp.]
MAGPAIGDVSIRGRAPQALEELVRRLVLDGQLGSGAQLAVWVDGEPALDLAVGTGTWGQLRPDHLHPAYCLLKPVLAIGAALAARQQGRTIDEPIGALWPDCPAALESLSIRAVAQHQAGLSDPTAAAWRLLPEPDRGEVLSVARPVAGPAYSEVVGGLLLEAVAEHLTGRPTVDHVMTQVLHGLGVADDLLLTADATTAAARSHRLCVPVTSHGSGAVPLLSELLTSQTQRSRPAFGGAASASGVARFYEAVARGLRAATPSPLEATLQDLTSATTDAFDDPLVGNRLAFRGPFMTDLGGSGISTTISRGAFGHTGGMTVALGFHDPDRRMTVGLYANGMVTRPATTVALRSAIVDAALGWADGRA